ncbi:MAG: F-box-like domain-containing protein [Parachlamydiales bacterium]|nr:F-box-like domain-containing protein [Parachlamydiales bacterium]
MSSICPTPQYHTAFIPKEIMLNISNHLDAVDILNASLVCKNWRQLFTDYTIFTDFVKNNPLLCRDDLTKLNPFKACVREAQIKNCILSHSLGENSFFVKKLSPINTSSRYETETKCDYIGILEDKFITQFRKTEYKSTANNEKYILASTINYESDYKFTHSLDNSLKFKRLNTPGVRFHKTCKFQNRTYLAIDTGLYEFKEGSFNEIFDACHSMEYKFIFDFVVAESGFYVRADKTIRSFYNDPNKVNKEIDVSINRPNMVIFNNCLVVQFETDHLHFYDQDLDIKFKIPLKGFAINSLLVWNNELIVAGSEPYIMVFNKEGSQTRLLKGHTAKVTHLETIGDYLLSASQDLTIRIWHPNGSSFEIDTDAKQISNLAVKGTQILLNRNNEDSVTLMNLTGKPPHIELNSIQYIVSPSLNAIGGVFKGFISKIKSLIP